MERDEDLTFEQRRDQETIDKLSEGGRGTYLFHKRDYANDIPNLDLNGQDYFIRGGLTLQTN